MAALDVPGEQIWVLRDPARPSEWVWWARDARGVTFARGEGFESDLEAAEDAERALEGLFLMIL